MGVTYILTTVNDTQETVRFDNKEDANEKWLISPGVVQGMDVAIPFCTSQKDFNGNHYIELRFTRQDQEDAVLAIYQGAQTDGDNVRLSSSVERAIYRNPGRVIGTVDRPGNRWTLVLQSKDPAPPPDQIGVVLAEIP